MKLIAYLTFLTTLFTSCMSSLNHRIIDKTYYHTYLYSSMRNEYGKGGGSRYLSLTFKKDSVMLLHIKEKSLPDKDGEYNTEQDIEKIFTATYYVSSNTIKTDNPILPELKVEGDTLIAPEIHLEYGKVAFSNSKFSLRKH